MDDIIVRPLKFEELPEMFRVFRDDWIDSVNTMTATFNYDNEGILIAIDFAGAIVGAIAGCIISDEVGFIGYFVVKNELRGQGIGRVLLERSLEHLGDRNIGLNAIEKVMSIYPKRGFNTPSFSGIIYRGNFKKIGLGAYSERQRTFDATRSTIKKYTQENYQKLIDYDITIHPVERERFLKQWMTSSVTTTYLAFHDDVIIGYGCVQILEPNIYYIGPVFADNPTTAKMLLQHLAQYIPDGAALTMEILTTNLATIEMAKRFGLSSTSQYTRLYTKAEIKIPVEKVFVLTTGAMGLI